MRNTGPIHLLTFPAPLEVPSCAKHQEFGPSMSGMPASLLIFPFLPFPVEDGAHLITAVTDRGSALWQ